MNELARKTMEDQIRQVMQGILELMGQDAETMASVNLDDLIFDSGTRSADIDELVNNKSHMAGVPTGFADVDRLFRRLRGGDLLVLSGQPGVGKTSFALNLATNAAKSGTAVAFFSLEMSVTQLVQRILCAEARVNLGNLRAGRLQEGDWNSIVNAAAILSNLDLYIDDTPGLTLDQMRATARSQMRDKKNGLVVVDYLQLMQHTVARRDGSRAVEVAEVSRGLKVLAEELNMPVLALSQLSSRAVESRSSKRPQLSDLRKFSSIEQDADIVMFIDRSMDEAEAESDNRPDWGTADLIVAKHRNGPTRDITLAFVPEYTRFMDFADDSRVPVP